MNKHERNTRTESNRDDALMGAHATSSLPLPSLNETIDCFTRWFTPFLTNEQRATTRAALNAFVNTGDLGARLHERLEQFHQQTLSASGRTSWLDEYWATQTLGKRTPISINDNYFFLFRQGEMDRTRHASSLIAAALNYKLVLDQKQIPSATKRQTPLCINQLKNLFSTTRIPDEKQDLLKRYTPENDDASSSSRYIVVFCRGNIHQMDLISKDGIPHSLGDIRKGIEAIVDHSMEEQPTSRSVGHLTALPRSDWARARSVLRQGSKHNIASLETIENALFTVHLDDQTPKDNLEACNGLLKGDSGNRWFDKSMQFIVFNDGFAGLNVERSGLDRATIIDFLDYVIGIDPNGIDQYSGAVQQGSPFIRELGFNLTPTFQKKITRAASGFTKQKGETVSRLFEFTDFDDKLLVKNEISSDALVQCALQLAHFYLKGSLAAVGQNISMRHYTSGRVQSMWVLTSEMIDFVKTMRNIEKDSSDKYEALKKAAEHHEKRTLECRGGDVPKQHLLELLNIYNRHPEEYQADFLTRLTSGGLSQQDIDKALTLFGSPGWTSMHHDAFETSFLASPTVIHQGSSPAHHKNIALGCVLHNGVLNCHLSTGQAQEKMLDEFIELWQYSLAELQTLLRHSLPELDIDIED